LKVQTGIVLGVALLALAAGGGYWLGQRNVERGGQPAAMPAQNPTATAAVAKPERKLLYYRNPMGLPDTSPTPKKDPMGMDYIPVYEGEDEAASGTSGSPGQIKISTGKIQKLGVRTEAASLRALDKIIRAAGRIEPDERSLYTITAKFEGYVERLHVNVTGQAVSKGQPLFEAYSPELISAQREYAIAAQGLQSLRATGSDAQNGMAPLAAASLARLKNWDISEEQIKSLTQSGEAKRTLTFRSPANGIVTERKAVQGMRFMPGEVLYQIANLSTVWIIADVFEQDIGLVKPGARAQIKINAYPGRSFEGAITYIYPTLKAETRTIPVRVELANPGQLLKPGMFAQMELAIHGKDQVVTVPASAVIDSGLRQIVLVQLQEGRFEPREVKLGARSEDYVEVLAGIKEGEAVVVAANFLIDAESNLKAAVGGFGAAPANAAGSAEVTPVKSPGVEHRAAGKLEAIDAKAGSVTITHGPVASLKWPAMTMEFVLANSGQLGNLKPGASVAFSFVERKPGEWLIVTLEGAGEQRPAAHSGH